MGVETWLLPEAGCLASLGPRQAGLGTKRLPAIPGHLSTCPEHPGRSAAPRWATLPSSSQLDRPLGRGCLFPGSAAASAPTPDVLEASTQHWQSL